MAEGLAKQIIASDLGVGPSDLEKHNYHVHSAGTFAMDGMPVSPEAVEAMDKQGIDIASHFSTAITKQLIDDATMIYCMTESHRRAVLEIQPDAASKVLRLDDQGDVDDPIGMGLSAYLRTAEMIRRGLDSRLKELIK